MSKIYDVIIIGAGTAGLSAREEVAKKTGNYLIVDPGPYGTTCARVGCMPSKVLIEAASLLHAETHFKKLGAQRASAGTVDTRKLLRHVRRLRDTFVLGNVKNMVQWRKTHLLRASARFISNDEIRAGKKTYRAKRFIVATGSEPVIPSDWSAPKSKLLTTDTFFELKSLPKRMAVIGSGPIGLEMGQAIARIGTEVTLFGEAKSIGGLTDPQVVRNVVETLAKELTFKDEVVEDVERVGSRFRVRTKVDTYLVDQVLVAIGRKPNLAFLGLEQLDVTYDSSGKLQLDPNFTIPGSRIQLVGDVNDYRPILHESGYQGFKIGRSEAPTDRAALAIAFTSPNIATVGESLKDLRSRKFAFVVGTARLVDQGRALAKLANDGVIRLYAAKSNGRLLGAELFCPEGEHLAHLLAWSIHAGLTVHDLRDFPFYHPTLEEGLDDALENARSKLRRRKLEAVIEAENLADGSTVRIPTGCSGATADKSKYLAARVVEPRGPR